MKAFLITSFFTIFILAVILSCNKTITNLHLKEPFHKVDSIPEGKAVVYIYRVIGNKGNYEDAYHYSINANEHQISNIHLYAGGYFVYYADPGKIKFWDQIADYRDSEVVDVEVGKTYYIEASIKSGTGHRYKNMALRKPKIYLIDEEIARDDIKNCKLLSR